MMLATSLACLIAGTVLAAGAPRFVAHAALAELLAGGLLILGLALIGAGLPVFR